MKTGLVFRHRVAVTRPDKYGISLQWDSFAG
ncbi:hypothetical protein AGROH133_07200 [Agrobacterium tumefaciens]|nr:hypothetical protein AGROH133_07200 [Agrobacterium tumefaciens]